MKHTHTQSESALDLDSLFVIVVYNTDVSIADGVLAQVTMEIIIISEYQ